MKIGYKTKYQRPFSHFRMVVSKYGCLQETNLRLQRILASLANFSTIKTCKSIDFLT